MEKGKEEMSKEIFEATLTPESVAVSIVVAGYVAKQLENKAVCYIYSSKLCGNEIEHNSYLADLSRSGLIVRTIKHSCPISVSWLFRLKNVR